MIVRGSRGQGSGHLLTPWLVLTAAHLVQDANLVQVVVPETGLRTACATVGAWYDPDNGTDVALLVSRTRLSGARARPVGASAAWAEVLSPDPVPGCQAIGFPYVQRDARGRLDSEQLTGTFKPGSGTVSGYGVLVADGMPPAPREDGLSPWAGMSGAVVFAGGALLGVIAADPGGWQHGRVAVSPLHRLLADRDFTAALETHEYPVRLTPLDDTAKFELRYGAYLAKRYDTLRIFGVDFSDGAGAAWPLDVAYYSMETVPTALGRPDAALPLPAGPVPADQALAENDRVLLRGVAGSGKTTLIQWLAVTAARQNLIDRRRQPRDMVPYVLPLRTIARRGHLPPPGEFLSSVEVPLDAPAGWADRVLADGRAMVLVDGLDEVDEPTRERVGHWLRGLLTAYPGNRWLVSSRPSVATGGWPAEEHFTELALSPMGRRGITTFVERWHEAARQNAGDDTAELTRIDGYQASLMASLAAKPDLARLAVNPLMCGLICALHRDRNGYLPTGRKELYDAALSMLLIRRDRERDLVPRLTEDPQVQLLQKLAYWLVRNGQAEMDQADALGLMAAALPSMPLVAAVGDERAVFRYLLERSGLLREPTPGTVDFIHRTFQDYLAGRAGIEERDFDLMTRNAHHDQWSDVIRMAVAHARPNERSRLLRKIIARGDRAKAHRARLHLLAMACLEHATELDPEVRAVVEERAGQLIPPRTYRDAEALAAVGPIVLELLPGPDLLDDPSEAARVVQTALHIGGEAALPVLRAFAARPWPQTVNLLRHFPPNVNAEEYALEVLARLPREDTVYVARSEDDLRVLAAMGGVRRIELHGAVPFHRLASLLEPRIVTQIDIRSPDVDNMVFLRHFPRLDTVSLQGFITATDLDDVLAVPGLTTLGIDGEAPKAVPHSSSERITRLTLVASSFPPWLDMIKKLLPGLEHLTLVAGRGRVVDLAPLADLPRLASVTVHKPEVLLNAHLLRVRITEVA